MKGKTDWGLPDWTNQGGYPTPPGHMTVWAWEFLRRWPEYRTFWEEKIEPFIDVTGGKLSPHKELNARLVFGQIYRDAAGNVWPHHEELKARFGVDVPSRPDSSTPAYFIANYISWAQNDGGEYRQTISLDEHQIAIMIDLTRPLKRQFERARKAADGEKKFRQLDKKQVRNRSDHYVQYLRILDAYEAGAKPGKIANFLFPNLPGPPENDRLKALHDDRTVAQNLRDGGYRGLLEAR